jgi:hypothetical protein
LSGFDAERLDRALAVLADLIGCDPMTLVNEAQKEVA